MEAKAKAKENCDGLQIDRATELSSIAGDSVRHVQGTLGWLEYNLPEGLVVDAVWLDQNGFSSVLRSRYVRAGWLNEVAPGVYRRLPMRFPIPDDEHLLWQNVVISLQALLKFPVTVGGRTALELQRFACYLTAQDPRKIHLYGEKPFVRRLSRLPLETGFLYHNAQKLFKSEPIARALGSLNANLRTGAHITTDSEYFGLAQQLYGPYNWPLTISTPERAILELMDGVPERETFRQVDVLMEGMRDLSVQRLNRVLADCQNVKVNRLFLWFAERHNHDWFSKVERRNIDLGRGKRLIFRGGILNTTYQITVPDNLDKER